VEVSEQKDSLSSQQEIVHAQEYEIKGVRYVFFSKRFWQYFAIMVIGNFFSTFFSYTYKSYGAAF